MRILALKPLVEGKGLEAGVGDDIGVANDLIGAAPFRLAGPL